MVISEEELVPVTLGGLGDAGTVFLGKGRILRGIPSDKIEETRLLLASGLIRRLEEGGLFPRTEIARDVLTAYSMTIEHERLHPLVLPSEWTPGMLQQAALTLVEVNCIARSFGYETKTGTPYSLSFVGTRPVFFDLGSFVRVEQNNLAWRAHDQFIRCVMYPLTICGRNILRTPAVLDLFCHRPMTYEDYIKLRLGFLANYISSKTLARGRIAYEKFRSLSCLPDEQIDRIQGPRFMKRSYKFLRAKGVFSRMTCDLPRLESRIRQITPRSAESRWSKYQRHLLNQDCDLVLKSRYERVCQLLWALKPESVLELAGGIGFFGLVLRNRGITRQVISTDSDVDAVETTFSLFKRRGQDCTTAVVDFMQESRSIRVPSVTERYRAHTVVALDLARHVILGRGVDIEFFMRRLALFCTRNAIVEFGLYNDTFAPPLPSGFSLDWFRTHFVAQFELMHEEPLEGNRILLVGRKRENYECQSTESVVRGILE